MPYSLFTPTRNPEINMTPIYNHRELVGYAKTAKQAQKMLRSILQSVPAGWKITVRARDTSIIDLPAGFIYSVHP